MPKITKRDKNTALYQAIAALNTPEECQAFFEDLCSPSELSAMEQRFAVAQLLMQDRVYTDILARTNASTSTISRVKRVLTDGSGVLTGAIGRARDDRQQEKQGE